MDLHVSIQQSSSNKSLLTNLTFVRLLASMITNMDRQTAPLREAFRTNHTSVWPLFGVRQHMHLFEFSADETFAAHLTCHRFLSGMRAHVHLQGASSGDRFATNMANVLLAIMRYLHVHLIASVRQYFIANLTGHRPLNVFWFVR